MKTNGVRVKKGQAVLAGRVLGALVLGGLWTVTAGNQVEAARDYSNLQDLGKVTLVEEKKEPVVVPAVRYLVRAASVFLAKKTSWKCRLMSFLFPKKRCRTSRLAILST